MVQFNQAGDVSCSFISDQTDTEFCKELVALLSKSYFLIEGETPLFSRRHLLREWSSCEFKGHLAGKLDFHLDGYDCQNESKDLLVLLFGHCC